MRANGTCGSNIYNTNSSSHGGEMKLECSKVLTLQSFPNKTFAQALRTTISISKRKYLFQL